MIHAAFHKVKLAQLFPKLALSVFLSVLAGAIFADQDNVTQWQQIRVPVGIYQVPGADGVTREIAPSCSGGPICKLDPVTQRPICRKGNREFSFFFKSGSEKQLLVYFEGGGACWDPNTCIASPQVSMALPIPSAAAMETNNDQSILCLAWLRVQHCDKTMSVAETKAADSRLISPNETVITIMTSTASAIQARS